MERLKKDGTDWCYDVLMRFDPKRLNRAELGHERFEHWTSWHLPGILTLVNLESKHPLTQLVRKAFFNKYRQHLHREPQNLDLANELLLFVSKHYAGKHFFRLVKRTISQTTQVVQEV